MANNEREVTLTPLDGLANKVVLFLYLNIGIDLIGSACSFATSAMESGIPEAAREENGPLMAMYIGTFIAGLAQIGLYITCAIFFCMWMYRAYLNSMIFMKGGNSVAVNTKSVGVNVIGSWAIPIYNLFKPYQNMKQIWVTSDPRTEGPAAAGKDKVPKDFPIWWAFWVLQGFTGQASFKLALKGGNEPLATGIDIADCIFTVIAAFLAVRIVKGISERQDHKIHTIQLGIKTP